MNKFMKILSFPWLYTVRKMDWNKFQYNGEILLNSFLIYFVTIFIKGDLEIIRK